jgi:DMSO/TMAO reductase YedYZ molybdopterin-dependent catalytic subunit
MKERSTPDRRRFLKAALGTGIAAVSASCLPQRSQPAATTAEPTVVVPPPQGEKPLPEGLDAANFHVHNRRPLALETRRSKLGVAAITPIELFFVRNNLPRPDASILTNRDAWRLEVAGVGVPQTVTLGELKQLAMQTITSVVQCSGNGRKFYEHGPSGSSWATGAAGCAMWTGVRVADLIEKLGGPLARAKFLTSTGGEVLPEGIDPLSAVVERSIPLEKGLQDCLLAWEMNGVPIPLTHGGPLRLIVPGYYGCNQIKYVKRLSCTPVETEAKIQKSGYRYRAIGESGTPEHPSMWRMNVKSWVNGPGADSEPVLHGKVQFHGVALSGERGVERVEFTLDDGVTWAPARFLGPPLGPNAWRPFTFEAELSAGTHVVATRATDANGDQQPPQRGANERGYGHNGWRDHALTLDVVTEMPKVEAVELTPSVGGPPGRLPNSAELSTDGKRGKGLMTQAEPPCGACHTLGDSGLNGAVGPNLDQLRPGAEQVEAALENGVGVMPSYQQTLTNEQRRLIASYIAEAVK